MSAKKRKPTNETNRRSVQREQPRKDSKTKRVNFDNERASKFKKDLENLYVRGDSNDIRWYTKNPSRIQAAGRLQFASINGLTPIANGTTNDYTVPGVMRILYAPNFATNQVVVEQAFQNLYSEIVHANSRNQSYDYTDLAIMMSAGIEIFSAIALGIRAYGFMRKYEEQNVYYPDLLLEGGGFDAADLKKNYSHMWDDLLQLIAQSRQIWIPNTMAIVERRLWMNLNAYYDSSSSKAQVYMYTPATFYKYEGYTSSKGGKLVAMTEGVVMKYKWQDYLNAVQSMIDALIPDQDRGIMYGDILKAYGQEKIFALNDIAIDYKTNISYNPEVLWQIENLTYAGGYPVEFYQDNLKLLQKYTSFGTNSGFAAGATKTVSIINLMAPPKVLMNFHQSEQPTPEQITIATRMTVAGSTMTQRYKYDSASKSWVKDTDKYCYIPNAMGTEIPVAVHMLCRTYKRETGEWQIEVGHIYNSGPLKSTDTMMWSAFDWTPAFYKLKSSTPVEDVNMTISEVYAELDNYAYVTQDELKRLHNAVIYSLYNVPTI